MKHFKIFFNISFIFLLFKKKLHCDNKPKSIVRLLIWQL